METFDPAEWSFSLEMTNIKDPSVRMSQLIPQSIGLEILETLFEKLPEQEEFEIEYGSPIEQQNQTD